MFPKTSSLFHWWHYIVLFQNTVNPKIGNTETKIGQLYAF